MKAITELRKTGWYLVTDDDSHHTDDQGNMWFTQEIALGIGRELKVMPLRSSGGGLKNVVTGYVTGDPS